MLLGSYFLHYPLISEANTAVAWMGSVTFCDIGSIGLLVLILLIMQNFYIKVVFICYKVACFSPQI